MKNRDIKTLQARIRRVCYTEVLWNELAESVPDWWDVDGDWDWMSRMTNRLKSASRDTREMICDAICHWVKAEHQSQHWIGWTDESNENADSNIIALTLEIMSAMGLLAVLVME